MISPIYKKKLLEASSYVNKTLSTPKKAIIGAIALASIAFLLRAKKVNSQEELTPSSTTINFEKAKETENSDIPSPETLIETPSSTTNNSEEPQNNTDGSSSHDEERLEETSEESGVDPNLSTTSTFKEAAKKDALHLGMQYLEQDKRELAKEQFTKLAEQTEDKNLQLASRFQLLCLDIDQFDTHSELYCEYFFSICISNPSFSFYNPQKFEQMTDRLFNDIEVTNEDMASLNELITRINELNNSITNGKSPTRNAKKVFTNIEKGLQEKKAELETYYKKLCYLYSNQDKPPQHTKKATILKKFKGLKGW